MKTLKTLKTELAAEIPDFSEMVDVELNNLRLSERLRTARKSAGLTQQAVADRMHVNRAYISQLESRPQNITIATLLKYSRAVGARLKVEI